MKKKETINSFFTQKSEKKKKKENSFKKDLCRTRQNLQPFCFDEFRVGKKKKEKHQKKRGKQKEETKRKHKQIREKEKITPVFVKNPCENEKVHFTPQPPILPLLKTLFLFKKGSGFLFG